MRRAPETHSLRDLLRNQGRATKSFPEVSGGLTTPLYLQLSKDVVDVILYSRHFYAEARSYLLV